MFKDKESLSKAVLLKAKCHSSVRQVLERCYIEVHYEKNGLWSPGWYGMIYCPDHLFSDTEQYLPYIDWVGQDLDILEFGCRSASEAIQILKKQGLSGNPKRYLELLYVLT